tara:strand:- start:254 stop:667 length:414 start_codon:yes stop_codon:yes gene_type:complete
MDARTVNYLPPWNQQKIRSGKPMKPAPFYVNFVSEGNYIFKLSRWPLESGLALGAEILDARQGTMVTDAIIKGEAMTFKNAFIKVGNQELKVKVDNNLQTADFELTIPKGKTELLAWFELEDKTLTNSFYINVFRSK